MNIFVTGGAGFIGSHVVDRLLRDGHDVTVWDNGDMSRLKHNFRNGSFNYVYSDLGHIDPDFLDGVEMVMHLAAYSRVAIERDLVPELYRANVQNTAALLEAMAGKDIKKFVFASSSTVYGNAVIPTPESYPADPVSHYGASKLAGEAMVAAYCREYGIPGVIMRLANIVGPRASKGVVFDLLQKLKADPNRLEILGDGHQKKSYLHVSDVVDFVDIFVNNRPKGLLTFNVGNIDQLSVLSIIAVFMEVLDIRNPRLTTAPNWTGDVTSSLLDISRAMELGWRPKMNSLQAVHTAVRESLQKD